MKAFVYLAVYMVWTSQSRDILGLRWDKCIYIPRALYYIRETDRDKSLESGHWSRKSKQKINAKIAVNFLLVMFNLTTCISIADRTPLYRARELCVRGLN